jgi:hypothetical protein
LTWVTDPGELMSVKGPAGKRVYLQPSAALVQRRKLPVHDRLQCIGSRGRAHIAAWMSLRSDAS